MEGRGNEGKGGPCPQKLSTPQLKFLVAPLLETEVCTEIPDTKILLYTSSTHN